MADRAVGTGDTERVAKPVATGTGVVGTSVGTSVGDDGNVTHLATVP